MTKPTEIDQSQMLRIMENPCFQRDIRKYSEVLKLIPKGESRVKYYHGIVDGRSLVAKQNTVIYDCKKGCGWCCHINTTATSEEIHVIVKHMKENNVEIDVKNLKNQLKYGVGENGFNKLKPTERRCVFLDEKNSCKIYSVRPGRCRSYFVVKGHCGENHYNTKVPAFWDIELEAAHYAMMVCSPFDINYEYSMPQGLLLELHRRKDEK